MSAKPTPKAYSYLRFSTPEQASGDSEPRQLDRAHAWAKKKGVPLDDSLRDKGVSAYQGKNVEEGALGVFLNLVENGRIAQGSYLVVEDQDRLSRGDPVEAMYLLRRLVRAGVTVVNLARGDGEHAEITGEKLRDDPGILFTVVADAVRAYSESVVKSKRVSDGWKAARNKARTSKKPLTKQCPAWLEVRDEKFHKIPERVEVVRRIFRDALRGHGKREIVRRLNIDRIPTFRPSEKRKSKGWQESSVGKILTGKMVIGEFQPHEGTHKLKNRQPVGEPITDYYPRIIDEKTYWRVQEAIRARQTSAGRKGDGIGHLLTGLVKCANCGATMNYLNKGQRPKGATYFGCGSNIRRTGCKNDRRWRADKIEKRLLDVVAFLHFEAVSVAPRFKDEHEEIEGLQGKLRALESGLEALLDLVEKRNAGATARYEARSEEAALVRSELDAKRDALSLKEAAPSVSDYLRDASTLVTKMQRADGDVRRDLRVQLSGILRGLIQKVDFHAKIGAVAIFQPTNKGRWGYGTGGKAPAPLRGSMDKKTKMMSAEVLLDDVSKVEIEKFIGW